MYKKTLAKKPMKKGTLKEIFPKGSVTKGVKPVSDPSRYGNKNSNKKVSVISGFKKVA